MEHLPSKKAFLGLDMEGFWRHSLCVGVSAKLLAKKRGVDTKLTEEFFTAGLLHDIGKIPLNGILSKEYMLTVSDADKKRTSLFNTEEQTLGLNHCTAGAMISAAWKLEGAVGDTIMHHHSYQDYSGDHKDILLSVVAANRFASISGIGFSGNRYPDPVPSHVWKALNVSKEVFDELEEKVHSEIQKAEVFLKISHL
jgi:putative nucleotidyltransferase with HDIG domain